MKLISRVEWSIFGGTIAVIFFALLIQIISTNSIDQLSGRKLLNNLENLNRYKRDILQGPPHITNACTLVTITNEVSKLREIVATLTSSSSLSSVNELSSTSFEMINELERKMSTLWKQLAEIDDYIKKTVTSIHKKRNSMIIHDVVEKIQSKQFSQAENLLKLSNDINYNNVVEAVYNHNADNIGLILDFGGFISDTERKFEIYDALFNQMKVNGDKNAYELLRLREAVKKEILDRDADATAAQSLIDNLFNAIQPAAIETITNSFLNDNLWSKITYISSILVRDFPQSYVYYVYKKVIDNVYDTLGAQKITDRAIKITDLESEMIVLQAVFDEMESRRTLNTNPAIFLARGMISVMKDGNYRNISSDRRTSFENRKNKIMALWILTVGG